MDTQTAPLRLVSYGRVSTEEQKVSGLGLEVQRDALDREFAYQGDAWERVAHFEDEGLSGSNLERPELLRALDEIAHGNADGIVVSKLDRLTRSVVDFGELLEWLAAAEGVLVAIDFKLDTSTASGMMVAQILVVVSEWERRTIAERTTNALAAKRAAGEIVGRASVADRPELVELIRTLADSGLSLHAIARQLNDEDVPTIRGGTQWRASSVQTILGYRRPAARRRGSPLPDPRPRGRRLQGRGRHR